MTECPGHLMGLSNMDFGIQSVMVMIQMAQVYLLLFDMVLLPIVMMGSHGQLVLHCLIIANIGNLFVMVMVSLLLLPIIMKRALIVLTVLIGNLLISLVRRGNQFVMVMVSS